MMPCRVVRVALLPALVMPALRRMISASGRLPLDSIRAFLHSIIPAPVRSRSSFTNFALISMISFTLVSLFPARLFHRLGGGADFFGGFRSRTLARQGHGRQILVRQPFRHQLIELL